MENKKRVAYFYDDSIGNFNYGSEHPMKPKRISMTHELIVSYGMYKQMDVYQPHFASIEQMNEYHDKDYLEFLRISDRRLSSGDYDSNQVIANYNGQCSRELTSEDQKFIENYKKGNYKVGQTNDCPVFQGLFNFCQISAGASWDSAILLAENQAEVCINWAGGLHHAKKTEASGFCYVNDIVIAILVLLKYFQRVLYIDIDVHHGDGVEEAFYCTNRVMTVSFHQYGDDFFPGSGNIDSLGQAQGHNYAINVPLKPGMNDEAYGPLFKNVIERVMEHYQPNVIVLQCGADSIVNDKLGNFNLSTFGHGEAVSTVLKYGLPTMLLGGGGYTIENVSRLWTYETSIALNTKLDDNLPSRDRYYDYYKNDSKLHIHAKNNVENKNSKAEIHKIEIQVYNILKNLEGAPGMTIQQNPLDNFMPHFNQMWQDVEENNNPKDKDNLVSRRDNMNL